MLTISSAGFWLKPKKRWLFRGLNITVPEASIMAISGKSGCGKSTFLQCISGLLPLNEGTSKINSTQLSNVSRRMRTKNLRESIGFIFQDYHLVPGLTILQNVELSFTLSGGDVSRSSPQEALKRLGIWDIRNELPEHVSGGQKQRAAIARVLVKNVDVVFADEPTGSLDDDNTVEVLQEIRNLANFCHASVVLVTHDNDVADYADEVFRFSSRKGDG